MAKTLEAQRRAAAEEVCWTLLLMMSLTDWDISDPDQKKWFIARYDKWVDLAVKTGVLKDIEAVDG